MKSVGFGEIFRLADKNRKLVEIEGICNLIK
jgi:hypothetical protein